MTTISAAGDGPQPGGTGGARAARPAPGATVKPFRSRPHRPVVVRPDIYRLFHLNDAAHVRFGVGMALAMALIIAGQVFVGSTLTFLTLIPIVVGIVLTAVRNPWTAVLLYLAYGAMEGMYKYLSSFSPAVYIIAPGLLGVIALAWGLSRRSRASGDVPPMMVPVLVYCTVAVVQSANPNGSGVAPSLAAAFLWYIGPALMYLVACTTVKQSRQLVAFFYVLLAVGTVVAGFAIVQQQMGREWCYAKLPGYQTAMEAATAYTSFRPASTTTGGGGAAPYSHFAIAAGLVLLLAPTTKSGVRLLIAGAMGICGVALVLSGVRLIVMLDLACIALFLVLNARSPREVARSLGAMAAVLLLFWIVTNVGQNLSGGKVLDRYTATLANPLERFRTERGNNVDALYTMISEQPLGYGFRRGLGVYTDEGASGINRETQLNCWQADMGLPGLIAGALLLCQMAFISWRTYRTVRMPHLRPFAVMLFAFTISYIPSTLAGPSLQGTVNFWVLIALAATLPRIEREERARLAEETARIEAEAAGGGHPAPAGRGVRVRPARQSAAQG
jgi:hypothetical protein